MEEFPFYSDTYVILLISDKKTNQGLTIKPITEKCTYYIKQLVSFRNSPIHPPISRFL